MGLIFLTAVNQATAETTLDEIQRTSVLKLAIRENAAPLGYVDDNEDIQGYCLDFFKILQAQVKQQLNKKVLAVRLVKSTVSTRFNLVANQIAHLECGPNTIRNDIDNVAFSQPFLVTGTQFLVTEQFQGIGSNLNQARIGVIKDTSTAALIRERYPMATIVEFLGLSSRTRGVQAVEQRKIDAFVSDGILLKAEAARQGLSTEEYQIVPTTPLTCDYYGMIIPADDARWRDIVNSTINSPQLQKINSLWFPESNLLASESRLCSPTAIEAVEQD